MTVDDRQIQWFVARDGKQHGPLTDIEMAKLVELGHLRPNDLVWRYGFADWRPAPSVFPQPEPKAPVPQPAATAEAPAPAAELVPAPAAGPSVIADPVQAAAGEPVPQPAAEPGAAPVPAVAPEPQAVTAPEPHPVAVQQPSLQEAAPRPAPAAPGPAAMPRQDRPAPRPDFIPRPVPREAAQPAVPRPPMGQAPAARPRQMAPGQAGSPLPSSSPSRDGAAAPRRSGFMRVAASVLLLTVVAGGAFAGFTYREKIAAFVGAAKAGFAAKSDAPPVIHNDSAAKMTTAGEATTASLETPPANPAPQTAAPAAAPPIAQAAPGVRPVPTTQDRDAELQTRPLWTAVKQEFPEWYAARLDEATKLGAEGKSESEITQHLVESLVALRRQNAQPALAASTEKHKAVATAFLANLKQLAVDGGEGCYDFISKGETSPTIVARLGDPQKAAPIEGQLLAIVDAIAEGRRQPAAHVAPGKPDYDVLAAELGKLGWTQADMQLFADPRALARAPHERVCTMLQDWFKAHLEVKDPSVQARLLFETLKPVISG